jgi:hypothetical protein
MLRGNRGEFVIEGQAWKSEVTGKGSRFNVPGSTFHYLFGL